jgi:N-acetylglucosaminyl-diphospho-decaprenol L-rhamnosyltransferase
MPAKKITAVVVTYQSEPTIATTISQLKKAHQCGMLDCIFVDNNSRDQTASLLMQESSWAKVLLSKGNNGFGRGCNIGLSHVATPYTLFINPDAVIDAVALAKLCDFLEQHPTVGIVAPATLCGDERGERWYQATGLLPTPTSLLRRAIPLLHAKPELRAVLPGEQPFRTEWICGAIMLVRTSLARKLGGFDSRFFLYWEEMDFCLRAAQVGAETWITGLIQARHVCGASSANDKTKIFGCIAKHFYESRRYYMIKHHGWFAATMLDVLEFISIVLRTTMDMLCGKGYARILPRLQASVFGLPRANLTNEIHD